MNTRGSGYMGTSKIENTTIENTELVPIEPKITPYGRCVFYKMSFMNYQDCRISINNGTPIFLKAEQGFSSDRGDALISSFKILESNIEYQFISAY